MHTEANSEAETSEPSSETFLILKSTQDPQDLPEDLSLLISEVSRDADKLRVDGYHFDMLNFAESSLWLSTLELINERGIPETADEELASWATMSFRLAESTAKAAKLRNGWVSRKDCMTTNRAQGAEAALKDLQYSYRLLTLFQKQDAEVTIPDFISTLRRARVPSN